MSKSVINALAGILVRNGKLSLGGPVGIWPKTDPRSRITLNNLLQMSSGLRFFEGYKQSSVSDVRRMLLLENDMASFMKDRKFQDPPGRVFRYSSGDTMLISHMLRKSFRSMQKYREFPWRELFYKIGMRSAVFETDGTGLYIGASNLYATARDWAKFGLLYLNDGFWNGKRILPAGWVNYSKKLSPQSGVRNYGAHFWGLPDSMAKKYSIPRDIFMAVGFKYQMLFIIPSRDLVIVRMGWTDPGGWDMYEFLHRILATNI